MSEYRWRFRVALVAVNSGDESNDRVLAELSARGAALVTKSWQKSSRRSERPGDTRVFANSGVRLALTSKERIEPEEAIAALEREVRARDLVGLLKRLSCQMAIVLELYSDSSTPPFALSADAVSLLAEIGADVDIDLYAYNDEA